MIFHRLIRRLRRVHPDHHVIAHDMAWIALLVLAGKLAGAAKEMAIAYRFGISAEVDAYLFVFNLVTWPVGVWFSALIVVLVPLAARIHNSSEAQFARFRSELFGLSLVVGLLLACMAWVGMPWLITAPWAGLSADTASSTVHMAPVLTLLAPIGVIISLYSALMLAAGRHVNTLMESIPALTILVALLMFPTDGVEPLIWGTLAGFVFHVVALAVSLARRGEVDTPRFTLQSQYWSPFWQGFGVMFLGQLAMSFTGIIDQFFAANLGTGAIATLGYANRVLALILGIGALAVGRATLPIFSSAQAINSAHIIRVMGRWVNLLFVMGVIALVIGWWLAPWCIRLLFEYGKFTAENTVVVINTLRYGLIQLPFYFPSLVTVSFLASQGKYNFISFIGVTGLVIKFAANILIVPFFGVDGLMISTSFMSMISSLLLYVVAFKQINKK